ncbi:MAG: MgtC/SapB family protein [Plesiomonas shigelloides]
MEQNLQLAPFWTLLIALCLGAVIGIQRGWTLRNEETGRRIAGIRTYSLIGLTGGISGLLSRAFSPLVLGFVLLALAAIIALAYHYRQQQHMNLSITDSVGMLLTCLLGALATAGYPLLAAPAAVLTTLILDNKQELHNALQKLQEYELDAALRLLLISVVMLPLLPNEGFGPWQAINPYQIWWMVVLIAGISFISHFAIKIGGPQKGILFTSVCAGFSSSTALTLQFSHLSRQEPELSPLLASGILLSCGTMFPRVLLVCFVLNPALFRELWPAMLLMMLGFYLPACVIWWCHRHQQYQQPASSQNPLSLSAALFFGLLLLLIIVLSKALGLWFGQAGTLLLAAISGLTDVDAITLALAQQSRHGALTIAVQGIFIAAAVNSVVKMAMTVFIGNRRLGFLTGAPVLLSVLAGSLLLLRTF